MFLFPKNFFWGTATSSHQIEGDNMNNDWWEAEQKGLVPHKSGKACDSYARYEEDFDLAKAMANNAHRFSIEWSRIEPEEGKFNEAEIERYRKVLQALRARGLEPFVTLHHFTNPVWFSRKGGWRNKKAPEYFERYVEYVAQYLGREVMYWITINEPTVLTMMGYNAGLWPPFRKKDICALLTLASNLAKAHNAAYEILHRAHTQVGIVHNKSYLQSAHEGSLLGALEAPVVFFSKYFANRILDKIKHHQDFVGINYYSRYRFSFTRGIFTDGENKSDFGWEIYPEGIYHVVREIYRKYKKPIYITENGISDARDDQRPKFIKNHLIWLHKAMTVPYSHDRGFNVTAEKKQEFGGADVRGYFHWSLLDNFEWAEGFTQRFGLVGVDFETFARKMRPSGELYGEICKNNGLSEYQK